jgi:hypothetical protein
MEENCGHLLSRRLFVEYRHVVFARHPQSVQKHCESSCDRDYGTLFGCVPAALRESEA